METEWTFRQRMILILGSGAIIAAVYLGMKYIFPIVSPFVIAYLIALAIERPVNALAKKLGGRKVLASTILMVLLTALLLTGVGYLVCLGIGEIKALVRNFDYYMIVVRQTAARICLNIDGWFGLVDGCCMEFLCRCAERFVAAFTNDGGSQVMGQVMRVSLPVVIKIIAVTGAVIVSLMSVVYLSNLLERIRIWRRETIFYREAAVVTDSLRRLLNVYFKVQLIIMLINATLCVAGLMLIKNPYAVVIGILIGLIDALPIFGTGTVLLPWALFLLIAKNYTGAAVLISVYLITYFVREIMESKCMGDRMGIAPFTMLMVIFIGLMVYGIMGFILGPVSYCIIKALILYLKTVLERGKLSSI